MTIKSIKKKLKSTQKVKKRGHTKELKFEQTNKIVQQMDNE